MIPHRLLTETTWFHQLTRFSCKWTITPQVQLLDYFSPVVKFDAGEKHYPVSVETFFSSSLLLRRPKTPGDIQQSMDQMDQDDDDDEEEDASASTAGGDGGAAAHDQRQQERMQQACGECGQRQGWRLPSKGGWELVALPLGAQSWSTATLLEAQQRDKGLNEFRCDCPSCKECTATALLMLSRRSRQDQVQRCQVLYEMIAELEVISSLRRACCPWST